MSKKKGNLGEAIASEYLAKKGYKIIERNWCTRWAELDIVALDGDTLVFVEVKTRFDPTKVSPEESMTHKKLSTLSRSAQLYVANHQSLPERLRIDFVGIEFRKGKMKRINLIKNISV